MTMKTPEELAEEYLRKMWGHDGDATEEMHCVSDFLAGYQASAPQWISVKDRLPKVGAVVLVAKDIGSVNTTYFGVNGFRDDPVTHWMPLPKPPEEEG